MSEIYMRIFVIKTTVMSPYPRDFQSTERASSIATAAARALRKVKKDLGRKQATSWTVRIFPG